MYQVDGPPIDGKSLVPWLFARRGGAGADGPPQWGSGQRDEARQAISIPTATARQLATEQARLGAPVSLKTPIPYWVPPKPPREAHWIEFYALGNLQVGL